MTPPRGRVFEESDLMNRPFRQVGTDDTATLSLDVHLNLSRMSFAFTAVPTLFFQDAPLEGR